MQDCNCYAVVNTFLINCTFFHTIIGDFDQIRMINLVYILTQRVNGVVGKISPEEVLHGRTKYWQYIFILIKSTHSLLFFVVLRCFLPTNSFIMCHRKHLRIRRATFISWPFLFRFMKN